MVEFNHDIWNNWILEGYRFILVKQLDTRFIVKPVREKLPDEMLLSLDVRLYRIRQDEIFLLAENNGVMNVFCEDINPAD